MSVSHTLADHLSKLETDDIVTATQAARTKATGLLNDQGISAMALMLSGVFAEALEHPERFLEKTS